MSVFYPAVIPVVLIFQTLCLSAECCPQWRIVYIIHIFYKSTYPTYQLIIGVCPILLSNDLSTHTSSLPKTPISISSEITYQKDHNCLITNLVFHTFDFRVNSSTSFYFIDFNGSSHCSNKTFRVNKHYICNPHLYMKYMEILD